MTSDLRWLREDVPRWDTDKQSIIGDAPAGTFALPCPAPGAIVPGDWWRVERPDGQVVALSSMDIVWGDGEILLAVDPAQQGHGVGAWMLDQIESEARARGIRYVYNAVSPTHPQRARVSMWFRDHGFAHADHGDRLQRRVRQIEDLVEQSAADL